MNELRIFPKNMPKIFFIDKTSNAIYNFCFFFLKFYRNYYCLLFTGICAISDAETFQENWTIVNTGSHSFCRQPFLCCGVSIEDFDFFLLNRIPYMIKCS